MNKNLILVVLISVVILIGGAFLLTKNGSAPNPSTSSVEIGVPDHLEYFWGDGCPHCAKVAEFMDSWDKKDQVNIEKIETWYDRNNAQKLQAVSDYCEIPKNQQGVPVLFTPEGKCIQGDTPIIEYLKNIQ